MTHSPQPFGPDFPSSGLSSCVPSPWYPNEQFFLFSFRCGPNTLLALLQVTGHLLYSLFPFSVFSFPALSYPLRRVCTHHWSPSSPVSPLHTHYRAIGIRALHSFPFFSHFCLGASPCPLQRMSCASYEWHLVVLGMYNITHRREFACFDHCVVTIVILHSRWIDSLPP